MVALASLASQSAKKLFQKGNLEKRRMFAHKVFILIPTFIGDSTNFLPISLGTET